MKAIIIAVGDELISGKTVDTNSAYLARELTLRGIETQAHTTVGDNEEAIAAALRRAAGSEAGVVIVSGGIGPTRDDLTRQGLARAMSAELVLDEACLAHVESFFKRRHRKMVPTNRIQAMIPAGAEPLDNELGTAPGIAAKLDGTDVFILPGVPHEMRGMFAKCVCPRLPRPPVAILQRLVHAFGTGESDVGSLVADLMSDREGQTTVGTTVSAGLISVRITVRAATEELARSGADSLVADVCGRLGEMVVGTDDETMAPAVGRLLRDRHQTVATAESCTGGLVGQLLTSVSGASDYYLGGVVAYANEVKRDALGVSEEVLASHGAVSEQTAQAMAAGCREHLASDWAVSITGIAGPTGGTEEKPVGLVYVGLAGPDGVRTHRHVFTGTREHIRQRAAVTALNHLRLALMRE